MKMSLSAAICAVSILFATGGSAPALADGEGTDSRLHVGRSTCLAAEGRWRDNGDISMCCVDEGCFICEVDALECTFDAPADRQYTYEEVLEFLQPAPAVPNQTAPEAS